MNSIIKYVGKRLPNVLKEPLIQIYQKWNSKIIWDKELIKDLMLFFDLSYDETLCMLKVGRRVVISQWDILNPKTDDEIKEFYERVRYNAFSLAYWHMQRAQRKFRDKIVKISSGDVLDYGGGIGDLCIKLVEKGLNVSYCDARSENMEFAKRLFKKRGYEIKVLDSGINFLEEYDTILCIDVIEHIPHPEIVLERFARHLRTNGKLIITNLNCSGDDDASLHLKMDFEAEKLLNSFGLYKVDYDGLWIKNER